MTGGQATGEARSGTNFDASFLFLPPPRRKALGAVYAFCRATDDIADRDEPGALRAARLREWKEDLERALSGKPAPPVLAELASVSREFRIPHRHYFDLLRGVGMDVATVRYATFPDLEEYCTLVASAVGLMCLDIFGRRNERTERYAREVGIALQLTNIIRDVGVDASMGRLYLPLDDVARFGCSTEEILAARDSGEFRRLLRFQADRAEEYYSLASAALDRSDLPAMRPARVMQGIYHRLLTNIRRASFDVLGGRMRVSRAARLSVAIRYGVLERLFPG